MHSNYKTLIFTSCICFHPIIQSLYDNANTELSGPVDYRHMFVDFSNVQLNVNGSEVHTCPAAMGASFATGTTDGPGGIDFESGVCVCLCVCVCFN